ncbi:sulfite exporter TauE/SafE family protein, partial [bacterium]|nr:sulfite exporter TauE/SafE family protein [bacterium]
NEKHSQNNICEHELKRQDSEKHIHLTNIRQYPHQGSSRHENERHIHNQYNPNLSIWSNIILGISGGIVPCPKAIVILLLAISLHKIAFGIIIILVFSLGLAFTLVILGIIVVKTSYLLKKRFEDKRLQMIPIFGATVIIGLGIFLTYQSVNIILIK